MDGIVLGWLPRERMTRAMCGWMNSIIDVHDNCERSRYFLVLEHFDADSIIRNYDLIVAIHCEMFYRNLFIFLDMACVEKVTLHSFL